MLSTLIHRFVEEYNMSKFSSQPQSGHFILNFADNHSLDIFEFDTCYAIKGVIGPFPKQIQEKKLSKVMDANLFGKGTKGGVIGFEQGQLILSQELPKEIKYEVFCQALEDFLNTLDELASDFTSLSAT